MIQEEVLPFIPQRPPFVMIDKLVRADGEASETTFTIREGHLLVENGFFIEAGLVENMAQTAAAGTGSKAQQESKQAPVGYIGAIKALQVKQLPAVGETITTTITFVHQVMNAHIVQGVVKIGDAEIASCELKIFLQSDIEETGK
jgi:3-hydroxyacyl-[acyl-carrier-protein] dehydratase